VIHTDPSPLAGRTVDVAVRGVPVLALLDESFTTRPAGLIGDPFTDPDSVFAARFTVHDWSDRVHGCSWRDETCPASITYALRAGFASSRCAHQMADDDVLHGDITWAGDDRGDGGTFLVHVSELAVGVAT
jgi:hypothetical protein